MMYTYYQVLLSQCQNRESVVETDYYNRCNLVARPLFFTKIVTNKEQGSLKASIYKINFVYDMPSNYKYYNIKKRKKLYVTQNRMV